MVCVLQTQEVLAARWNQYLCCSSRKRCVQEQLTLRGPPLVGEDKQRELSTAELVQPGDGGLLMGGRAS